MLSISLGVVICCLLGFLLWRFAFPRANTVAELAKMALLSVGLCLFLLGLAFAAWRVRDYNSAVISAEPATSVSELPGHESRDALIMGNISTLQPDAPDSDYAAYLRWSAIGDADPSDIEYELPELIVELDDATLLYVDGFTYDDVNWSQAEQFNYVYRFIDQGDRVVVAGEMYDGTRNGSPELYLTPTFVFAGDDVAFSAEYAPTLRRTATYAQILQYISLGAAALILVSPLPQLVYLSQKKSS